VSEHALDPAVVLLNGIHKFYDMGESRLHALRGISLRVGAGEFLGVMGASGSGKSTLMNIIGCLDQQSSGEYFLEQTNVAGLDKRMLATVRNKKIGFIFQGFNLIARTTALDNVALPMLYTQATKAERMQRAAEALSAVGLANRANSLPSQLSGGQQQRVAIARALVNRPSLLIADEPTGNLDSRTSIEVMDVLQRLNGKGLTIVMVTHEPDIAKFATRIIDIRDGRIRKDEPVPQQSSAAEILKTLPPPEEE
jgi:putative ABC transport system ATP-binding protein